MPTTILINREGQTVERTGMSAITITGQRNGDDMQVEIEMDVQTTEEAQALIGTLLTQLEEFAGEQFVAQCVAHYANSTGKLFSSADGNQGYAIIRGRKDK